MHGNPWKSRRAAVAVAMAFAVLTAACDAEPPTMPGGDEWDGRPESSIYPGYDLSPDSTTLQPGGTVQMVFRGPNGPVRLPSGTSWSILNPAVAQVSSGGLVTGVGAGTTHVVMTYRGVSDSSVIRVASTEAPAAVTGLAVAGVTETSVTLRWTAVSDGQGGAANYAVRYGSPAISWESAASTERAIAGGAVGTQMVYTYSGLTPGRTYQFRIVSYRGTLGQGAVLGPLSNVVSATTTQPTVTVVSVTVTPSSHTFTQVGAQQQLTATARDANGNTVSGVQYNWSSTNPSVVSVDNMGMMRSQAVGTALVIVSAACCTAADTVSVTVQGSTPPPPSGTVLFSDGFESGNLTGAQGGSWYGANRATVSNARARTGSYSLRFQYPGSSDPSADSWSEIRGRFPRAPEVWMEWYLYVPTNYEHRNASGPDNNKFWILGYADHLHGGWQGQPGGWTARMELNPASVSGSLSRSRLVYGNETSGASSENAAGTGPAMNQYGSVITTADRGTWVRFGVHLKLATSIGASNGEVHFYKNGQRVISSVGMPIGGTSFSNPIDCFELMGWANSGFNQETIFFIDDVKIYSTNPGW